MKRKFIDAGIPAQQVAIIHDYITDAKREALYKQINNGEVTDRTRHDREIRYRSKYAGASAHARQSGRTHTSYGLPATHRRIVRQGNLHLQMDKPVRILRLGSKNKRLMLRATNG